jgi:hypothetical protein
MILESRVVELSSNENIIKARIYANADQADLDLKYKAGINTQVNPVQSFAYDAVVANPDHSVNSNKFNIYSQTPGVRALDAEINRINKDLSATMKTLDTYRKELIIIQDALIVTQQKQSQNIFNKIGKAIAPGPEDLIKDQIVKSRIANVLLLQGLATTYNNFSTDPETQQRAYPDEVKLPETLLKIRQTFWATANQFHDPFVQSSPPVISSSINFIDPKSPDKLNFDDPGDPSNIDTIAKKLKLLRPVAYNDKLTSDVDQFIKDNAVVTNDSFVSRGIDRRSGSVLLTSNSLRSQTESYPAVALSLGKNYIGSFEIPSINAAIKKWWKKKNATFSSLPLCPNIPTPSPTDTEAKQTAAEVAQEDYFNKGAVSYRTALKKAVTQAQAINSIRVSDLPPNAPHWVANYVSRYGDSGVSGAIMWTGDPFIVSRAIDKNLPVAIIAAQKAFYTPKSSSTPASLAGTPAIPATATSPGRPAVPGIANIVNQWAYRQGTTEMCVVFVLWKLIGYGPFGVLEAL